MLKFERVPINSRRWDEDLNNHPERTIFQTPAWLAFVAQAQNAEPVVAMLKDGDKQLGYFTGLIIQRLGFRILGSPFPGWTTSYMGFCLATEVPRRLALEALLCFAFKDLACAHLEVMDRNVTETELVGLGFDYRISSGFEIDLTKPEQLLFDSMSSACRRCIRKAHKSGVTVSEAYDLEFASEYYSQLEDVFAKQGLAPTYSRKRVTELIEHISPTGMLLLLRAYNPKGDCIATGIFPAMNRTMYFWGGASWRRHQDLRPNEAIQWHAMKYWKSRGIQIYDMGGGGEYKRKYGGSAIAVPWLRKSKYSYISHLRNFAEQLMKRRQILAGRWHGKNSLTAQGSSSY